VLFPTTFLDKVGPRHSTCVPSSAVVAVPVRVEEKDVAFVALNLAHYHLSGTLISWYKGIN